MQRVSVTNVSSRLCRTCLCGDINHFYIVVFRMVVVSIVGSLHQVKKSLFWFCSEKQAEDNGIPVWRQPKPPHQEKGPKQGFSAWRCLFRPYARQPTGNARNARLPLDRRPCSTYWLLVGWATGTMSKMSSHTIGTRHLWLFGHGKNERFTLRTLTALVLPLTHSERCGSGQTQLTFLGRVWKAEEKVSPESNQAVPFGVI